MDKLPPFSAHYFKREGCHQYFFLQNSSNVLRKTDIEASQLSPLRITEIVTIIKNFWPNKNERGENVRMVN